MADPNAYAATFELIDADNDGLISAAELKALVSALGDDVSDDAAEEAVRVIDTDGDGLVSLPELTEYLGSRAAG